MRNIFIWRSYSGINAPIIAGCVENVAGLNGGEFPRRKILFLLRNVFRISLSLFRFQKHVRNTIIDYLLDKYFAAIAPGDKETFIPRFERGNVAFGNVSTC